MTRRRHIKHHIKLHLMLDELISDFIRHTGNLPSKSTVFDLLEWSYKQTVNPDEKE